MARQKEQWELTQKDVQRWDFRHFFALSFYQREKDIVLLAGVLGHKNMETTKRYLLRSSEDYRQSLDALGLVREAV